MTGPAVDYDRIAADYDRRYARTGPDGRTQAIERLADALKAKYTLEVGCGTGHWLEQLAEAGSTLLFGLDPSTGMLALARRRGTKLHLTNGVAESLPYREQVFALLLCVQAIHHLADPRSFIREAYRVLRDGGTIAILGSDPREPHDRWYVYDYFEHTLETDLRRKPSWPTLSSWLTQAGFADTKLTAAEQINDTKLGSEVLQDPFLSRNGCSQLALLSEEAYAAGIARIKAALKEAESSREPLAFPCRISISMLTGRKNGRSGSLGPG